MVFTNYMSDIIKYKHNPFLSDLVIKQGSKKITASANRFDVIDKNTGEVNGACFGTYKKVDKEEFVKIYTANVGVIFELNGAGKKLFQILAMRLQEVSINKDTVYLDEETARELAQKIGIKMAKTTYYTGIKNLIMKKIIAKSVSTNLFFINPNVIFNGDRLVVFNAYEKIKDNDLIDTQSELDI